MISEKYEDDLELIIEELEQQNAELRYALDAAARSLETVSKKAGIDEYMNEFCEVRGYAQNRAWVAREALASRPKPGGGE